LGENEPNRVSIKLARQGKRRKVPEERGRGKSRKLKTSVFKTKIGGESRSEAARGRDFEKDRR